MLYELGVAPTIDDCADCHAPIDGDAPAMFSHPVGRIALSAMRHDSREADARFRRRRARALRDWLGGAQHPLSDANDVRAHQRLLREFLREHLADDRPLRAFEVWERDDWTGGAA